MLDRVTAKKYLRPPVFMEDEEKTRLASLLHTILLALLIIVVIYASLAFFIYSRPIFVIIFSLVTVPLWLAGLVLIRLGYVPLVARLLPLVLWLVVTLATIGYGGVDAASFSAYVTVIFMAGLLLGARAGLNFTILSILTGFGMFFVDLSGRSFLPLEPVSPAMKFSVHIFIFILVGTLLYLAIRSINEAMDRAYKNEQALIESNRKLAARTRDLEKQKETVKTSEERFRAIFNNATLGIGLVDTSGRYIQVNNRWSEMLGYDSEEIYQTTHLDVSHPEDVTISRRKLQALIQGEIDSYRLEKRFVRKDGTTFWGDLSVFPLRNLGGQVEAIIGMIVDISERKKAEKAVRESEQRYRALFEGAGDAIFLIQEGRFVDCNAQAQKMFGCTREQIIGAALQDLSPVDQPDGKRSEEKVREKIQMALQGKTVTFDWQHRRCNDGSLFDTEVILTSFILSEKPYVLAIGRDVMHRKQAVDEREQFTLQLSTAAEIAGQASAILDPDVLLKTVIRLVKERFELYYVHLYLLDEKERMLRLRTGYGEPGQIMLAHGHNISLDQEQSLVAQAARTKTVVYVSDVKKSPHFLPNPLLPDTESEVAVPLIAGEQVLGVFDIQHDVRNYFSRSYLDVFKTLAGQVAVALQNATFVEQIEWSLTETKVRFEVSQALAGAQTEAEVLDILIQQAGLYPQARISIHLLDPEADEQCFVVHRSNAFKSGLSGSEEGTRYSVSEFPTLNLVGPDRPFVSAHLPEDERLDPASREFVRRMGYVSMAIVPLAAGSEWLGAIVAASAQPGYFDRRKVDLYQALAEQGAIALQSARLRESLQESEAKYSAVVEQATDGVIIIQDNLLKFVNQTMATILGYSPEAISNVAFLEFVAPQSRALIVNRIKARLKGEAPPSIYEAKLLRQDGTGVDVEISAGIIQYQGKPANLGIIRDVTERKETEQEIRRRNRELSLLNRIIAASVASSGPQELLETACRELAQAFEVPQVAAALLNEDKTVAIIVAEYLNEGSQPSALNQILFNAGDSLFQVLYASKSPLIVSDIRTEPRLAPIRDMLQQRGILSLVSIPLIVQDQVVGSLGMGDFKPRTFSSEEISLTWSVADQVAGSLARLRLDKERRQLSTAIEQTAESVLITDPEGTILYVNPAFEQVSGYSRTEAIGRKPSILRSSKQDASFYRELWQTISAGQVWHGRFVNRKKDGSLYTEEATITPVRDEHGDIVNYVSVQRDVTRELELEEQYRQAQKMEAVGQLAAGVAHDFNNLLTAINGFTDLIQSALPADDPLRELTGKVLSTGQRATDLVRQLLTFSRRQIVEPQLLNLNTVVKNMYRMLQPLLGDHIELEIVLDPNLWSVKADPSQLEQVLANLTINARDAMPEGGLLTVETGNVVLSEAYAQGHLNAEPGQYVMLSVNDTGVGMSEETKKRIFEPFFTTKEAGKGTGLGLATVFGVVRQSNGHIWVYSEPNQGTTFKIYLPQAADATVPLPNFEVATPLPQGTETILLVEDEPVVRDLAAAVLGQQGYTLLMAANGQKAWTMIHQLNQKIDLLLTDLVMPKVGGKALAEQLRHIQPDLKVIFISGYTSHTVSQQLKLEPGAAFIQKPFSPAALAQKVREVLDSEQ